MTMLRRVLTASAITIALESKAFSTTTGVAAGRSGFAAVTGFSY